MLHPDADRRIDDIQKMSELFKEKRYTKTAREILTFAEILKGNKVPTDFLEKLDSLFDLFHKDFVENFPVGQKYRQKCFKEIRGVIFGAVVSTYPKFNQVVLSLYPFIQRLNHGRKILGSIADWMTPKKIKDKNLRVHLLCYSYLLIVEGLFDELARILYYFEEVSTGSTPSVRDLQKITVWDILKAVKPPPTFLQNWDEKKHIRNAIGHARAFYDAANNEIRFVDIFEKEAKITYDETISIKRFGEITMEMEDSVMAFLYIIIMLRLHDLIRSKDIYK